MTDPNEPREPEPSMGADEEGEFPLHETTETDDHAAWVHRKTDTDGGTGED